MSLSAYEDLVIRMAVHQEDENDPYARPPDPLPGIKLDQDKPRADLLLDMSRALMAVAEVSTFGAQKYAAHDWLKVPNAEERYMAALWRHLLQSSNERFDPDSKLEHYAHIAWNALAILELARRGG